MEFKVRRGHGLKMGCSVATMIAMLNAPIGCEWVFDAYFALAGSGIAGEAVLRRSTRISSPAARPKDEQCKDEHNWADEWDHTSSIAWPRPATEGPPPVTHQL